MMFDSNPMRPCFPFFIASMLLLLYTVVHLCCYAPALLCISFQVSFGFASGCIHNAISPDCVSREDGAVSLNFTLNNTGNRIASLHQRNVAFGLKRDITPNCMSCS